MFEPYPHQRAIVDRVKPVIEKNGYGILTAECRCGKSIIALMTAHELGYKKVLILSQKSALASIKNDIKLTNFDMHVDVINYASAHKFKDNDYDFLVTDEAHAYGAFPKPGPRAKVVFEIGKKVKAFLAMSATLSTESWSNIYHIMKANPHSPWKQYANFYKWAKVYVNVTQRNIRGTMKNDYTDAKLERVMADIKPSVITLTQEEAGFESKDPIHFIHDVEMRPGVKRIINELKAFGIYQFATLPGYVLADSAVKLLSKHHQLSSGCVKDEDGTYHVLSHSVGEYIEEKFKDKRIGIFYCFIAERQMILESVKKEFCYDQQTWLDTDKDFLGQVKSSSQGLSLKGADALVFVNVPYSSLIYEQVTQRASYREREDAPECHWIFTSQLQKDILRIVQEKKKYSSEYYKRFKKGNLV